jgi:hypothetical protein
MAVRTRSSRENRFLSSLSEFQEANRNPIIECMKIPLLTLEEAVASVTNFIPEVINHVAIAKELCRQNATLTINESAAIYLYTMINSFYLKLNEALRAQNPLVLRRWFPFFRLFLTALNKLPSSSIAVWRGVKGNVVDEFVVGAEHTWSGVNSCSSHVNVAGCFAGPNGTLFCIHALRAKDISAYSANQTEEETIVLPEARLRVKSTLRDPDGLSVVILEEW